MKGLYCRAAESDAEPRFVIQETVNVLGDHEVRVKVKACGLSPLDFKNCFLSCSVRENLSKNGLTLIEAGQTGKCLWGVITCEKANVSLFAAVQKPEKLSWVSVAAALRDGVCAYTALHTHARMAAGHTLLVMDGASPFGLMCIQLACYHGLKVLATSHSPQQQTFLEQLRPSVGLYSSVVIPVHSGSDLLSVVLEETGGLGVDIVVDSEVRLHEDEEEGEERKLLPHKHDIISVLGVVGHWVTSHKNLQLDPPDCRLLHLKSASVSFLNPEVWTASAAQQGRYLHILKDISRKLIMVLILCRPQTEEAVPLYEATVAMETVQRHHRKKAVVQL
uniref:Crystallin, zeta (quinone reductase)-like 1 n=1 Tax=Cyprinodon variegatus TaxID=28743 RepID=A0A3Q2D9K8_CYPVA